MKKLIILIASVFLLLGCATVGGQAGEVKDESTVQLTPVEVSEILKFAISDMEKSGCKPEFLSESGLFIWARCSEKEKPKDYTMKVYNLKPIMSAVIKKKAGKNSDAASDNKPN